MFNLLMVYLFFLVFVRMTAFFVTAPIYSSRGVPTQFKIGLGFFTSLVILPTIGDEIPNLSIGSMFLVLILQETLFGLLLGWIAQLLITSIQIAGSFIDMQIGFAIANVIDPQTGFSSPLMGNFKYMFAMLLFLTLNGHHLLIDSIVSSYQLLPISGSWLTRLNDESLLFFVVNTFTQMFVIALKIAAPIVGTLFLSDVALGIVARTVPQLNVFVVGLPLKIIIHFLILFILVPGFIYLFQDLFQEMFTSMRQLMDIMGS